MLSQRAAASAGFDTATAASVWAAALGYIAPRSLEPLSIPQMSIWGLQGLTALDPDLNAALQEGQIRLYGPDQLLIAIPAPAADDAKAWGAAAAAVAAAGFAASPALRQAGTQGLISSFFDELFNHFDPYSRYEPPLQAAEDQLMITGIAGAGLTLGVLGNVVIIATVAVDGPAAEAGLVPGIQVLAVNGLAAYPAGVDALNSNLNGIPGSPIMLHLADPTTPGATSDVTLVRAYVPAQTVSAMPLGTATIGLRISGFNRGTSDQLSAALVSALANQQKATGMVIDLRGNRGGVLRQAVLVADSLLASGTIVTADGRDPDADQSFGAVGADLTGGLRLVVLVDGQTASAAEVLAAALADNHRAVVVGSETLGKGLVQTLTRLPDGGELYVTWSRVLAPRGWPLQALGVMPQVCTSLGPDALTTQLNALNAGQNLLGASLAASRAARAPIAVDQLLSMRNACPAAIGGNLDLTAANFLLAHPAAYQAALLPQ